MKTLIIGLDAFDPLIFERLSDRGKVPNLSRFVETGGYSRFRVSNPPQSEVSWTSISTGVDPGGHGIFDFVHRNPETYSLEASLLPTRGSALGTQFVPPSNARTLFEEATRLGYQATSLFWPATFPARLELPVRTIPGLGTPDIQGRLGVGCAFVTEEVSGSEELKTPVRKLQASGKHLFLGVLPGPKVKTRRGDTEATLHFQLDVNNEHQSARLKIGKHDLELIEGQWSPIFELNFKIGLFYSLKAVTRVVLTKIYPDPQLYFLPLQIHPLHSPWRYGTPPGFIRETWETSGPFLTLGWPQDTTGLEEGWISDDQFITLCETIVKGREQILRYHLSRFREGVLACVFDTLDRMQHMFLAQRQDLIEAWYVKMDEMVGRLVTGMLRKGEEPFNLLIVSDHGFAPFEYKVHLNRWLQEQGLLSTRDRIESGSLNEVDWSRTQAYALGLNSLYLNLAGREGRGIVSTEEKGPLLMRIAQALTSWQGPDGRPVVHRVYFQEEAFTGPLATYGPDMIIGYSTGYRTSAETGLGKWKPETIEKNRDHWAADHCFDAGLVPGVILSNQNLSHLESLSYQDFPELALGREMQPGSVDPPRQNRGDEDQELIEERLKSLGYL